MTDRARELLLEGAEHDRAGRHAEALEAFRAALVLNPREAILHFNVGNALRNLGRTAEAVAAYDEALALAPNFAIAHHNRATCRLKLGDLAGGFREYEWRKACPGFVEDARYKLPRPWRGEDLRGKRLFVYGELFQGDIMQFSRYAALAAQLGGAVTLSAPASMHALLRTVTPSLTLTDIDAPAPDYDYQSAMMTLPALFGTSLETVPAVHGYFRAEPARVARWRERIDADGVKVGIAWHGSPRAVQRSFPVAEAAAALRRAPGVRLISLQKHAGLEQLEALAPGTVETLGDDFDPGPDAFVDTAAAMVCCDLFITPDTSVVHVAGGLGVPTWLALNTPGDWRWFDESRRDTPWYPSVRIFRQRTAGDWAGVFEDMAAELGRAAREGGLR